MAPGDRQASAEISTTYKQRTERVIPVVVGRRVNECCDNKENTLSIAKRRRREFSTCAGELYVMRGEVFRGRSLPRVKRATRKRTVHAEPLAQL